jgi:hypothetical protein
MEWSHSNDFTVKVPEGSDAARYLALNQDFVVGPLPAKLDTDDEDDTPIAGPKLKAAATANPKVVVTTPPVVRIQLRIDDTANWNSNNPVLADGEPGIERISDGTRKLKIGDNVTAWTALPYQ